MRAINFIEPYREIPHIGNDMDTMTFWIIAAILFFIVGVMVYLKFENTNIPPTIG